MNVYLPNATNLAAQGVNTIFRFSNNNNDNNNNNSSSPNSSSVVVVNNPNRWCERCNREHPLDKEGFKKCPEMKVGMDYEDEPGYYEREDFDDQRKF
jgi:hypothetical protein